MASAALVFVEVVIAANINPLNTRITTAIASIGTVNNSIENTKTSIIPTLNIPLRLELSIIHPVKGRIVKAATPTPATVMPINNSEPPKCRIYRGNDALNINPQLIAARFIAQIMVKVLVQSGSLCERGSFIILLTHTLP
jgi:hypothetical protein